MPRLSDKPLLQQILEEQARRLEDEIRRLEGIEIEMWDGVANSEYLTHTPVNSGPDYLEVRASLWPTLKVTVDGKSIRNTEEARRIAHERGLKGISIKFGGSDD